jgi:hypothetical protein
MKFMATTADMILVTGADFTHTNSLLQLLASVERHEPGMRVMIYDLGMTQRELRRIEKQYRRYQIRKFDYGRYPAHFFIRECRRVRLEAGDRLAAALRNAKPGLLDGRGQCPDRRPEPDSRRAVARRLL